MESLKIQYLLKIQNGQVFRKLPERDARRRWKHPRIHVQDRSKPTSCLQMASRAQDSQNRQAGGGHSTSER